MCEHTTKIASLESFERCHQGVVREEGGGGREGKIKRKLSEVNIRAVSRGQNELIGKFKMVSGDVIRGHVVEYTYIPTIKGCCCFVHLDLAL